MQSDKLKKIKKELEPILIHIIEWAQKHKIKVEHLKPQHIREAIRCKF